MMSKTLIVASVLAVEAERVQQEGRDGAARFQPGSGHQRARALGHAARQFAGTQHRARRRLHHAQRLDHSGVLIRRSADPRSVVEE